MNKTLSIIVPTYNMEKYLDKCLSSLIISDENMQLLEVLIINDGSKDRSSKIAHLYESRYPQTFHVIDKENGNYGSCVNRGLKDATGKYIKVLDADDSFDKDIFDLFVDYLRKVDVDLVISDFKVVDDKETELETYTFPLPTNRNFNLGELSEGTIRWLWHHGITYRTEILRKINYHQTEGISYTDDEWIFSPMCLVRKACYFPHFLYLYLRGREGQTFDPKVLRKTFGSRIVVAKKMISDYKQIVDKCNEEEIRYLNIKLFERIRPIYNFYLIKNSTNEGNQMLADFDLIISKDCPKIFVQLGNIRNKVGWQYIQCWRKSGYCEAIFMLQLLRWKFKLKCMLSNNDGQDITMPKSLKRV